MLTIACLLTFCVCDGTKWQKRFFNNFKYVQHKASFVSLITVKYYGKCELTINQTLYVIFMKKYSTILLFAVLGTMVSTFIIGFLTFYAGKVQSLFTMLR